MSDSTVPPIKRPSRRPLKIYATDPMLETGVSLSYGNRARIDVDNEQLHPGPSGARIQVVDYDGARDCYYPPVDLNDSDILMNGGIDPSESDPRFHQQMVYGVALRTLENFDRALGRTVRWGRRNGVPRVLRIFPHAFYGANAYYDPKLHALLFGCFRADRKEPGPNLPGQWVFTCLSHDIIAHETTHAILHRLRPHFLEPSNEDVLAFHEGFSDLVALLQHFSFRDVLRDQIAQARGDIRGATLLAQIGRQFGYATGLGEYLRTAIDKPDPLLLTKEHEPHRRGAIFLSAVVDAFFAMFDRRTRDLVRLAGVQIGAKATNDLPTDLLNRMVDEAARLAQALLDRCIRAFDYLPPVDITFGDYLRAMVTADYEISPEDEQGLRNALIEAFRRRGAYPIGVASFAEESLLWEQWEWEAERRLHPKAEMAVNLMNTSTLAHIVQASSFERDLAHRVSPEEYRSQLGRFYRSEVDSADETDSRDETFSFLHGFASRNCAGLRLDAKLPIQVASFNSVMRLLPNGRPRIEHVVQLLQQVPGSEAENGGIPLRGGTTMILSALGEVRYVIAKPLPMARGLSPAERERAEARIARQREYLNFMDLTDPRTPYYGKKDYANRMQLRMRLASLHQEFR